VVDKEVDYTKFKIIKNECTCLFIERI
jgi:hypothetical protein